MPNSPKRNNFHASCYLLRNYFLIGCIFIYSLGFSQSGTPRSVTAINAAWLFTKDSIITPTSRWDAIKLPHTWNIADVMDDQPGYHRGSCWYKKTLIIPAQLKGKKLSLYFEGANQVSEIYINGAKAGEHTGGYTGFSIPITTYLNTNSANEVLIKVNNRYDAAIAPLSADFTFYGGIYRDVFLVGTDKIHFTQSDCGSNGVYISTPQVSNQSVSVEVNSLVTNETELVKQITVVTTILSAKNILVSKKTDKLIINAHEDRTIKQIVPPINKPALWSPEAPNLYTVESKLYNEDGVLLDMVKNPLGLRWFHFDAERGFFLNGYPYKLIGASRHQDYEGLGNAVPNELAVQDIRLVKQMGGNFLRVAHYPQDPVILQTCDKMGLLASVEIPVVNEITESDSFYANCKKMQKEMIRQNFNHPSVIMWCYMNEVLLRPHFNNDKERQKQYFLSIEKLAHELEDLTRKEDPSRYTMMANHGSLSQYKAAGLLSIPMVVGWNLYSGWYGGSLNDFSRFMDDFHRDYPSTPFMITEYGADADPRIRSYDPVRFDKSIDYTTRFHQYYYKAIQQRPFVAGAAIWNLADFNSETRTETMPHINNKGLLQWNRKAKDPYFFYKGVLSTLPFIKIIGLDKKMIFQEDSLRSVAAIPVLVATNLDSVELRVGSKKTALLATVDGIAEGRPRLSGGSNRLVAVGWKACKPYADTTTVVVNIQPFYLSENKKPFTQMNILLGAKRFFTDSAGIIWQPSKAYAKGSWGHIGGVPYKLEGNGRLPYGTDKAIRQTINDPIYQTQQIGLTAYKLDVPDGRYQLKLHFAELIGGSVNSTPYNLNSKDRVEQNQQRTFHVAINERVFLKNFDIAKEVGDATPVVKTIIVTATAGNGITVNFEKVVGETALNALEIKKLN